MASPIAEAFVTIVPDFGQFDSDMKSGLKKAETLAAKAGEDIEDSFEEAARVAGDSFDGVGNEIERSVDNIDIDVSSEFETAGESGGSSFLGGAGGIIKGGIAAIGVAAAAALAAGFAGALGREDVTAGLQASLGLTEEEAQRAGDSAGRVYRAAWGDNLDQVSGVVESTIAGFGDLDDVELDSLVSQAFAIEKAFGIDANEAINSASLAVTNGLAKDGGEALDLLTGSFQNLTPVVRDEVIAATNEYSKSFAALGIEGPAAFGLLTKAGEQGVIGIDKAGDSIKEFTIRATDGSDTSLAAFEAIGLSGEEMANKFLAGGDVASDAFEDVVDGLLAIEDPAEQANTAIALFGTPLEDLGTDNIPDFLGALGGAGEELGDFEGSAQDAADVLGGTASVQFETFKREALGKLTDVVVNDVIPAFLQFKDFIMTDVVPVLQQVWADWEPIIKQIIAAIGGLVLWVQTEWPKLMAAIQPFIDFLVNEVWPIVQQIVGLVQEQFAAFLVYWDELWPKIQATLQNVWDAIMVIIEFALDVIRINIEVFMAVVTTLWDIFGETILTAVEVVWEYITTAIDVAINLILDIINTVTGLITGDWDQAWEGIKGIVDGVWEGIKNLINLALGVIEVAISLALDAIKVVWETVWGEVSGFVTGVWDDISEFVGAGIDGMMLLITAIPGLIKDAVTGGFDFITDGFRDAINAVIRIWNDLSLPSFKVGGWDIGFGIKAPTISTPAINLPDIRELANGGVVRTPTLALIGEAGPEVVSPLGRQRKDFLPGGGNDGAVVSINNANFYDGTDADLVAQKTMLALSARRLTA